MRKIFLFCIMFVGLASWAYSQTTVAEREAKKTAERIKRWMEWANPTPIIESSEALSLPMMPAIVLPDNANAAQFMDVNTIVNEPASGLIVQNESSIAVNPKNPKNLIAAAVDYRDNGARWVYVSSDGGRTWTNKNLGVPATGWSASNDPSVMFAADGTGYLMYGGFGNRATASPENGVFIARTTDEGVTWQSHFAVIRHTGPQTPDSNFEDKYYVHVDNSPTSPYFGRVYTPWKRVIGRDSSTQIVNTYSTDKGTTWSTPLRVSERLPGTSEDTTFGQSFPLTITGPMGEVYVVWNHGIVKGVGFAKSTDGAQTFSAPRIIQRYNPLGTARRINEGIRHTVKGRVRAESYPSIVCDIYTPNRKGWLYLVWAADSIPNVYFSRSTDGGDTWSAAKIVHSDTKNDQFWSWIALDPSNGDLAVMYLDSRDDPANILTSCYVSYSSDGGDTWYDKRISDAESDLRRNPFQGNGFAGDYNGCAFHNGIVYPSWVDMRNARQNINDNDVFTAIVNVNGLIPPPRFIAKTLPENSTAIQLNWAEVTMRGFNKPIGDYEYELMRDGKSVQKFPRTTTSFLDTGLEKFKRYDYSLRIVADGDSSAYVYSRAFSGGSREPGTPRLLQAKGSQDVNVNLSVALPLYRLDSTTLMVNARAVALYRDGIFIKEIDIASTDAGKTVMINDTPPVRGWYSYSVTLRDSETPSNESAQSNAIFLYTGAISDNYADNFEEGTLRKYWTSTAWGLANVGYASANSLTESPQGRYRRSMRDSIALFPVLTQGGSTRMSFRHAAIIHPTDSGIVEQSTDMGRTWTLVAAFNNSQFAPWADTILAADDWKHEIVSLSGADTILARFRFRSNLSQELDGWYIDDIVIGATASVTMTNEHNGVNVYPNPTRSALYIQGMDDEELTIYSILGEKMPVQYLQENPEKIVNVSSYANGVYGVYSKKYGTIHYFSVQR